ncbi:MAG: hypothetical protein ETSY1_46715 (plasmid) [Candidatus Entotheonella factor]|uniref:Uncharacterized protein n=1 Tax=Entotheonella factor TaxID=1429438 RepID=W4M0A7_ENTF1|nr:MAG: hypothetical protein ETSY1_46715 [Candidatus Entotheonella factor]
MVEVYGWLYRFSLEGKWTSGGTRLESSGFHTNAPARHAPRPRRARLAPACGSRSSTATSASTAPGSPAAAALPLGRWRLSNGQERLPSPCFQLACTACGKVTPLLAQSRTPAGLPACQTQAVVLASGPGPLRLQLPAPPAPPPLSLRPGTASLLAVWPLVGMAQPRGLSL